MPHSHNTPDDLKLQRLFADFKPDTGSDYLFMQRLQRRMENLDIIYKHNLESQRRNRRCAIWAALSGILVGIILSMLTILLPERLHVLSIGVYGYNWSITPYFLSVAILIGITALSIAASFAVYDLLRSRPAPVAR